MTDQIGNKNLNGGVNIQVVIRCRPPNKEESNHELCIKTFSQKKEVCVYSKLVHGKLTSKNYNFDYVYGPDSTQKELFDESISYLVDEVLQGYNCSVFCYGITSSGKTYTYVFSFYF